MLAPSLTCSKWQYELLQSRLTGGKKLTQIWCQHKARILTHYTSVFYLQYGVLVKLQKKIEIVAFLGGHSVFITRFLYDSIYNILEQCDYMQSRWWISIAPVYQYIAFSETCTEGRTTPKQNASALWGRHYLINGTFVFLLAYFL